jgi:hypothetical protein
MKSWLDETKASLEKWGVNPEDEFCSGAWGSPSGKEEMVVCW